MKTQQIDKAFSFGRLFLSAAVIAALITLPALAQDENSSNADSNNKTQAANNGDDSSTAEVITKDKTETTAQEKKAPKSSSSADERFIPTEEISEDLPVSFPVDI